MKTGTGDSDSGSDPMASGTDAKRPLPSSLTFDTIPNSSSAEPKSLFEAQVFQVTAQGGARRFYTHGSILSKWSQPLKSAVEGDSKESSERVIDLNDWDSDTVERLLQFLHTGGYQWPIPKKQSAEEPSSREGKKKIFTFEPPAPKAKTEFFEIDRPLTPIDQLFEADKTPTIPADYNAWLSTIRPAGYDFGDLLLAHAKVYALANCKNIENLKRLALDRTLKTLTALGSIENKSPEVAYIIVLLKYVYENTTSISHSREPMRKLVVRFTALNLTTLNSNNQVSGLMGSSAELAQDLMSDVTRRMQEFEIGTPIKVKRYISGLEVRVGGEEPWNCVQEYNWGDPNLNFKVLSPPFWLVPKFTEVEEQACTSFRKGAIPSFGHIYTWSDEASFLRTKEVLLACKDGGTSKIRHVQILRTSTPTAASIMERQPPGRTGILESINYHSPLASGTPSAFIHLMWKY